MVIVISLIMVFVLRRRKKSRASCDASEAVTLSSDSGATGSEKSNPTKDGFSRMSSDPFAPFGGRVDKSSYRPSTGTFELDGVAITAVELPATSIPEVPDTVKTAAAAPDEASEPSTAPPTPEPAATLASPSSPQGKTTYVNQWNEYKALEAGEASG
ncbi:hypothetical protein E4U47_004910 [Claviceps purpurea]|nr:hypothetical protein E4U47_004910 [Claviceps purpurea]